MKELLNYALVSATAAVVALGLEWSYHQINDVEVEPKQVMQCYESNNELYAEYKF